MSDLKEHFDKVDGSRIYFLHRKIVTHVQDFKFTKKKGTSANSVVITDTSSNSVSTGHVSSSSSQVPVVTPEQYQQIL
ncbi:hypothetical protein PVK06_012749 [Gossypium arboreum]|uniref:Uncharacterized protein n=1 Tax=Gossypium arboreum TaxID=29729 RepID=A0ABR0QDA8_GOSAR|nr:hypothetical protein PVK06_012749 [Gossypium arboreum]